MVELAPLLVMMNIDVVPSDAYFVLSTPNVSFSHVISKIKAADIHFNIFDEYGNGEVQTFLGNLLARISWYASWQKQTFRTMDLERFLGGYSRNDYENVFTSLMTDASALEKAQDEKWIEKEIYETFTLSIPKEKDFIENFPKVVKAGNLIKDSVDIYLKHNNYFIKSDKGKARLDKHNVFVKIMSNKKIAKLFGDPYKDKDPKKVEEALDKSALSQIWKSICLISEIAEIMIILDNTISDQREMLDTVYGSEDRKKLKVRMAQEVYNGFSEDIIDTIISRSVDKVLDELVKKIVEIGLDSVLTSGTATTVALGYGLSDLFVGVFDPHALKGVHDLEKAPLFMDLAEDAERVFKDKTSSGKCNEPTLNQIRLSALMMLLSERHGWDTMYNLASANYGANSLAYGYKVNIDKIDELTVALHASKESLTGEASDEFNNRFGEMTNVLSLAFSNLKKPAVATPTQTTTPSPSKQAGIPLSSEELFSILKANDWSFINAYGTSPATLLSFTGPNTMMTYEAANFTSTDHLGFYSLNEATGMENQTYEISEGKLKFSIIYGDYELMYDKQNKCFRSSEYNRIVLVPLPAKLKAKEEMLAKQSFLQSVLTNLGVVHFKLPRETFPEDYAPTYFDRPEKNDYSGYSWPFFSPDSELLFVLFTGNSKQVSEATGTNSKNSKKLLNPIGDLDGGFTLPEFTINKNNTQTLGKSGNEGVYITWPTPETVKTYSQNSRDLFKKIEKIHSRTHFEDMTRSNLNLSLYYDNLYPMGDRYSQNMADENERYVNQQTWYYFEPSQSASFPNSGIVLQFDKNSEKMGEGSVRLYRTNTNYSIDQSLPNEYERLQYEWREPFIFALKKQANSFTEDGDRIFELTMTSYDPEADYIIVEITETDKFPYTFNKG